MANQRPLALKSASSRRAPECDDGKMLAAFHAAELELDPDIRSVRHGLHGQAQKGATVMRPFNGTPEEKWAVPCVTRKP